MNKILLFTLEYPPQIGGIADYYGNLVNAWPKSDLISVLNTEENKNFVHLNWPYWPITAWRLAKYLRQKKIREVIVGHILPLGAITCFARWLYPFSYSLVLHGLDFSSAVRSWHKRQISYQILKKAKKIICANSFVAKQLSERWSDLAEKIIIINPGAKISAADPSLITQLIKDYNLTEKKIIFSLGRLVKRKGFDMMIEALAVLKERRPKQAANIIYFLAGNGPDQLRLQTLVQSKGLTKEIIFLGQISQAEKYAYFSLCHLFSMPARQIADDYEGFGIVYLEANLFAKPVIAGQSGGVAEAVLDQVSGLLINPSDILGIAKAIEQLLFDQPEWGQQLGIQGQKRAQEDFSWPGQAAKFRAVLFN